MLSSGELLSQHMEHFVQAVVVHGRLVGACAYAVGPDGAC